MSIIIRGCNGRNIVRIQALNKPILKAGTSDILPPHT
jgi:hypothetical protein